MQIPPIKPRLDAHVKAIIRTLVATCPDPRDSQGKRYGYTPLLSCIIYAILKGANTIADIAELAPLYASDCFPRDAKWRNPKRGCFDYLLGRLSADSITTAVSAHFATSVPQENEKELVHMDGKTIRGTQKTHILHIVNGSGILMAQSTIPDKTNEITVAEKVLSKIQLSEKVITADAMHTQKELARFLGFRNAFYFLPVKENQPTLLAECMLFIDVKPKENFHDFDFGHGRIETRTTELIEAPATVKYGFPGAEYVIRITRRREFKKTGKASEEVIYYVSSVPKLTAAQAHKIAKAHWTIENKLHCVLDITFREDRAQFLNKVRGNALGAFRRIALSILRSLGFQNIAKGRRILATI